MTTLPADELVERLRDDYENWSLGGTGPELLRQAADALFTQAATIEAQAAELSSLRAKLAEAMEVVRLWVGWCDDWHPGKSHPVDDLARARRLIEENGK